ncbi:hypothetical protein Q9966_015928 [Columba livia]|nr:hypothetical protein Q9966_015928 [Columba livia]
MQRELQMPDITCSRASNALGPPGHALSSAQGKRGVPSNQWSPFLGVEGAKRDIAPHTSAKLALISCVQDMNNAELATIALPSCSGFPNDSACSGDNTEVTLQALGDVSLGIWNTLISL